MSSKRHRKKIKRYYAAERAYWEWVEETNPYALMLDNLLPTNK